MGKELCFKSKSTKPMDGDGQKEECNSYAILRKLKKLQKLKTLEALLILVENTGVEPVTSCLPVSESAFF
ncbi:hypothetical protein [Spongiimicrobium sp. 3-5]|uniref:hypothetical protein n=1 Tax=Spongiimicrobium sp. 3-5 TaxID=3332596 RepID=UPI003980FA9F